MPNPLVQYKQTLKEWPQWLPQSMPAPFSDIPKYPGMFLGPPRLDIEYHQLPASKFIVESLASVWTMVPPEARQSLISSIVEVSNLIISNAQSFGSVALASIQGVASGVAVVGQVVQASIDLAKAYMGAIEGVIETNDNNRRKSRLDLVTGIENLGPSAWAISPWGRQTYERTRGLKSSEYPLCWPPDYTSGYGMIGPLLLSGAAERGNCSGGDNDFAGGLTSACRGWMRIFPLFFPVWCTASLGNFFTSLKGMERTSDGGAAVWAKMLTMQGALLGNPIANLQVDGNFVQRTWEHFSTFFWTRYFNPPKGMTNYAGTEKGLRPLLPGSGDESVYKIAQQFDPNFPAGLKKGFYLTPGGLIGTYNNDGTGTTDHPDLDRVGVYRWDSANTYSDHGNWITAANFNTVKAAVGQFFAMRMATLRRQPTMQALVKDFGEMLEKQELPSPAGGGEMRYVIPEKKVRAAIKAAADGAQDDQSIPLIVGKKTVVPNGKVDVVPGMVIPKRTPKQNQQAATGLSTGEKVLVGAGVAATGYVIWKRKFRRK